MNIRKCKMCGKEYDRDKTHSFYCENCKAIKVKEYELTSALRLLNNAKRYKGRNAVCENCGKVFIARQNQIFCDECRTKSRFFKYKHHAYPIERYFYNENGMVQVRGIKCKYCGKEFDGYPTKKYCSTQCRRAAAYKRNKEKQ